MSVSVYLRLQFSGLLLVLCVDMGLSGSKAVNVLSMGHHVPIIACHQIIGKNQVIEKHVIECV